MLTSLLTSASSGILIFPRPPSVLGVLIQAKWVKWESVEIPSTSAPISWNYGKLSENEISSVGQTYVKSNG